MEMPEATTDNSRPATAIDFSSLPILPKYTIRQSLGKLATLRLPPDSHKPYFSGGITDITLIKTQKAQGYWALEHAYNLYGVKLPPYAYLFPQCEWPKELPASKHGWFARPCPVTPRHGFVESRQVSTIEEAKAVFEEARAADPEAEMILTKRLSGQYSGVATNTGVAWALGHDGVTSSTACSYTIPTPGISKETWKFVLNVPHAFIKDTAYLELVEDDKNVQVVQYRDGPEVPTTKHFVPTRTEVKTILYAADYWNNLLGWEKLIKEHKGKEGVVVQLPAHSSLSSHYAVHAILAGIPAMTTKIYLGNILHPTEDMELKKLRQHEYTQLAKMVRRWLMVNPYTASSTIRTSTYKVVGSYLATAVASVHASPGWGRENHLLQLRAMAPALIFKYIAAAALGELRHWWRNGPGFRVLGAEPTTGGIWRDICGTGRNSIYEEIMSLHSVPDIARSLETAAKDFLTKGWANPKRADEEENRERVYGYGGPLWAGVAKAGYNIGTSLQAFLDNPGEETWVEVMMATNNAVHTVHNAGPTLSKWLPDRLFTDFARAPGSGFLNPIAAKIALGLHKEVM